MFYMYRLTPDILRFPPIPTLMFPLQDCCESKEYVTCIINTMDVMVAKTPLTVVPSSRLYKQKYHVNLNVLLLSRLVLILEHEFTL